jgi:hypothetical protein
LVTNQKRSNAVEIIQFDSHEDLAKALAEHNTKAMDGLHLAQRAIKPGDYWVRFVNLDVDPPVVEFGYVLTPTEIAASMLEDGQTWEETRDFVEERDRRLSELGMVYGTAASRFEPTPQLGETHVANVWPIEERLYRWAETVDWNVSKVTLALDPEHGVIDTPTARLLLEIAYRGIRAHYLGSQV